MKKTMKYFMFLLVSTMVVFTSCKDDDEPNGGGGTAGNSAISELAVTPNADVKYGDEVTLTAKFADEKGLRQYMISVSNANGAFYETTKMLTGKTYDMNEKIALPLPKNAVAGDLTISVTVKNSSNELSTEEVGIKGVTLPTFDALYLALDNNLVYTMEKDGNVFSVEDFIPAGATGKIYANSNKTGMSWGMEGDEIIALGKDNIVFGGEEEAYFKISFNAVSFELTLGNAQNWSPISESLYIFGTISGHWDDNDAPDNGIWVERSKTKMQGYQNGNRKYWAWTPPSDGTGSVETDMWGAIVAGQFYFKEGGKDNFLTFANRQLTLGAEDKAASFSITLGGAFSMKVFKEGEEYTKVELSDGTRTLAYTNEGIYINGALASSAISFCGSSLALIDGEYFSYEGLAQLTKDQTVTAEGVDLSMAYCDHDVFTGAGNPTWKMVAPTGEYLIRLDAFSGTVYVMNNVGYPDVIYMDGWCWNRFMGIERGSWNEKTRLTLYRTSPTANTYQAIATILPWGGDVSFWAVPYTAEEYGKYCISAKYFDGVTPAGDSGLLLPVPTEETYYKIVVDLKDGFTIDKENLDGNYYTIVPANSKKFTVTFTPTTL